VLKNISVTDLMYWPNYSYLDVNMAILKDAREKKDEAEKYSN